MFCSLNLLFGDILVAVAVAVLRKVAVVLQRTAKKCTKNYNTRAQPLFWSLNLLFGNVLVAVAVVGCLRSLIVLLIKPFVW